MKKLILVIISALIMTVFIAFNYLLWDREKIVGLDADKMASIDALSRQIRNIDEENKLIRQKSQDQDESIRSLQEKLNQTAAERGVFSNKVAMQEGAIAYLKQSANLKPLEDIVKKWVDSVNNGRYDIAYGLHSRQFIKQDINEFTSIYKKAVKSVSLKTLIFTIDGIPEDRKGEIVFKAVLEVKKNENSGNTPFVEGNNERFFSLGWDQYSRGWVITDIFTLP
ncbi:MAG: hypothetical protein K0R31_299 [Clostridiales bacterium]|jgi:hypothetical protein|nr:hypothetical protein [Clostridiales bacterium]